MILMILFGIVGVAAVAVGLVVLWVWAISKHPGGWEG